MTRYDLVLWALARNPGSTASDFADSVRSVSDNFLGLFSDPALAGRLMWNGVRKKLSVQDIDAELRAAEGNRHAERKQHGDPREKSAFESWNATGPGIDYLRGKGIPA